MSQRKVSGKIYVLACTGPMQEKKSRSTSSTSWIMPSGSRNATLFLEHQHMTTNLHEASSNETKCVGCYSGYPMLTYQACHDRNDMETNWHLESQSPSRISLGRRAGPFSGNLRRKDSPAKWTVCAFFFSQKNVEPPKMVKWCEIWEVFGNREDCSTLPLFVYILEFSKVECN